MSTFARQCKLWMDSPRRIAAMGPTLAMLLQKKEIAAAFLECCVQLDISSDVIIRHLGHF